MLAYLEELNRRRVHNKFFYTYPEKGEYSRDKYPKHLEFFKLGSTYNERMLLGGNRSGKSFCGIYESVCHLTGAYPDFWEGKRFFEPTNGWCCGDTSKTLRNTLQDLLLGPPGKPDLFGTGMIPADLIVRTTQRMGTPDAVESIFVKHVSGGISTLELKAYEQSRIAFQGTSQHFIHLDEECDQSIYTECLLRTLTTQGIIYVTCTPLLGLTDLMLAFLPEMAPASDDELKKVEVYQ